MRAVCYRDRGSSSGASGAPRGTTRNVFAGALEELLPEPPSGERVRVPLAITPPLIAEVTREAVEALGLAPGMNMLASFKASGITVVREPGPGPDHS